MAGGTIEERRIVRCADREIVPAARPLELPTAVFGFARLDNDFYGPRPVRVDDSQYCHLSGPV
jgi:hypothetical protein